MLCAAECERAFCNSSHQADEFALSGNALCVGPMAVSLGRRPPRCSTLRHCLTFAYYRLFDYVEPPIVLLSFGRLGVVTQTNLLHSNGV